jgi:hypothetical protein
MEGHRDLHAKSREALIGLLSKTAMVTGLAVLALTTGFAAEPNR